MSVGDAFDSFRTDILILENPPSLPEVLSDDAHSASWLSAIRECKPRTDVFYDEILELYLTVRLPFEGGAKDPSPPPYLVSLLLGLQIDLEGCYIASVPSTDSTAPSHEKPGSQLPPVTRPQAFPPNTPRPHPIASPSDESYILSQGKPFESYSLRDRCQTRRIEGRKFTLLRDSEQREWLAVYHLDIRVAFEANQPTQPLLCLTTTLTLRDQQAPIPFVSEAIARLWAEGEDSRNATPGQERQTSSLDHKAVHDIHREGKNLLESLQTSLDPKQLHFPYSRILENRQLAHRSPSRNDKPSFRPVMRKAHRKTLRPLTACHLQMFTALIPYMNTLDDPDFEDDAVPRASEERTVVLCLEIDSDGSDGHGFCVDSVEVRVQGEGCQTKLVGQESHQGFFPLHISPRSQYSLLYAILFKDQLPYKDILAAADRLVHPSMAVQRAIVIEITGRPYRLQSDAERSESYLTFPFATRWNCTLDLNAIHVGGRGQSRSKLDGNDTILPIPPSPFPATSLHELTYPSSNRHNRRLGLLEKRNSKDKPLPPLNDRISSLIMERRTSMRGKRQSRPSTPDQESPKRPASLQSAPSWSNIAFWPNGSSKNVIHHEPFPASPFKVNQGDLDTSVLSPSSTNHNATLTPSLQTLSQPKPRVEDSLIISVQFVAEKDSISPIIYPGTRFGLEVFIFNKSSVTRELQICFAENMPVLGCPVHTPIVPLETDVRVGPLGPESCQAVRLHLLALEPGVHTIDNLMVKDIGSKRNMTLRSVADVVIKDPNYSDN